MKLLSSLFFALTLLPSFAQGADAPDFRMQQAPGYYRAKLGNFFLTVLSDGTVQVPFDKLLHGISTEELKKRAAARGVAPNRDASINAFLFDIGGKRVMVDAGAGPVFGDCCGHLPETLKQAGFAPESIDAILLTHVHGDHSSGLSRDGKKIFPNATIYVAKADLDYWLDDKNKAGAKKSHLKMFGEAHAALDPYIEAKQMKPFEGATELFSGVRTIPAPGHTPGHTYYEFLSEGHKLRILGDINHFNEVQFPNPEITVDFDVNEKAAGKEREKEFAEMARAHELVAAPHLPFPGIGTVYREGKGFGFAPLPYSSRVEEIGGKF